MDGGIGTGGLRRRGLVAGLAAAALLAASAVPAQENKRVRANNPDHTPPGALFETYREAVAIGDREGNVMVAAVGGPETVEAIAERMAGFGPDGHAAEFMFAYNGHVHSQLQMRWVAELYEDGASPEVLRGHWVRTRTAEGKVEMPLLAAASLHWLTMHMAANARAQAPVPDALEGDYIALAVGECPIASGRMSFAREDFVVEGRREGKLLLAGAIGATKAYFVANEQFYLTVRTREGGVDLEVPDAPNELWQARLGGGQIALEGRLLEQCSITLTPVG